MGIFLRVLLTEDSRSIKVVDIRTQSSKPPVYLSVLSSITALFNMVTTGSTIALTSTRPGVMLFYRTGSQIKVCKKNVDGKATLATVSNIKLTSASLTSKSNIAATRRDSGADSNQARVFYQGADDMLREFVIDSDGTVEDKAISASTNALKGTSLAAVVQNDADQSQDQIDNQLPMPDILFYQDADDVYFALSSEPGSWVDPVAVDPKQPGEKGTTIQAYIGLLPAPTVYVTYAAEKSSPQKFVRYSVTVEALYDTGLSDPAFKLDKPAFKYADANKGRFAAIWVPSPSSGGGGGIGQAIGPVDGFNFYSQMEKGTGNAQVAAVYQPDPQGSSSYTLTIVWENAKGLAARTYQGKWDKQTIVGSFAAKGHGKGGEADGWNDEDSLAIDVAPEDETPDQKTPKAAVPRDNDVSGVQDVNCGLFDMSPSADCNIVMATTSDATPPQVYPPLTSAVTTKIVKNTVRAPLMSASPTLSTCVSPESSSKPRTGIRFLLRLFIASSLNWNDVSKFRMQAAAQSAVLISLCLIAVLPVSKSARPLSHSHSQPSHITELFDMVTTGSTIALTSTRPGVMLFYRTGSQIKVYKKNVDGKATLATVSNIKLTSASLTSKSNIAATRVRFILLVRFIVSAHRSTTLLQRDSGSDSNQARVFYQGADDMLREFVIASDGTVEDKAIGANTNALKGTSLAAVVQNDADQSQDQIDNQLPMPDVLFYQDADDPESWVDPVAVDPRQPGERGTTIQAYIGLVPVPTVYVTYAMQGSSPQRFVRYSVTVEALYNTGLSDPAFNLDKPAFTYAYANKGRFAAIWVPSPSSGGGGIGQAIGPVDGFNFYSQMEKGTGNGVFEGAAQIAAVYQPDPKGSSSYTLTIVWENAKGLASRTNQGKWDKQTIDGSFAAKAHSDDGWNGWNDEEAVDIDVEDGTSY
ncbi:hypothetical protein EVG20_g10290 [Dentipellis fragilis]|uniref:Fucose-specific lectin n=1 Tax=Dentipellis fragilis TaxID=205917 RepID=A0A4Y9XTF4_9AGAM|nr:hypothetical protein EVG20_g10290 [Dentipellis fragilis]